MTHLAPMTVRALTVMISSNTRVLLGRELAALYDAVSAPMPLSLIERMARFAVAEAMVEFDCSRQRRAALNAKPEQFGELRPAP